MKIIARVLIFFFLAEITSGQSMGATSAEQISELKSRVGKLESTVKEYSDLKLRMKETSNALADLNKELNKVETDVYSLSVEYKENSKLPAPAKPSEDVNAKALEDINIIETEISFIRQEIAKLQEKKAVEKTISEKQEPEVKKTKSDFEEAISTPWVGFIAFVIAILGWFR